MNENQDTEIMHKNGYIGPKPEKVGYYGDNSKNDENSKEIEKNILTIHSPPSNRLFHNPQKLNIKTKSDGNIGKNAKVAESEKQTSAPGTEVPKSKPQSGRNSQNVSSSVNSGTVFNDKINNLDIGNLKKLVKIEENVSKIMNQCTFQPKISDVYEFEEDFLTRQEKLQKESERQKEYTRKEFEKLKSSEIKAAPIISKKSQQICKRKNTPGQSAFERLYPKSKEKIKSDPQISRNKKMQNSDSQDYLAKFCTVKTSIKEISEFNPTINFMSQPSSPSGNSKKIKRNSSVETILYNDAFKRSQNLQTLQSENFSKILENSNLKHSTIKSSQYFILHFDKIYNEAWKNTLKKEKAILCEQTLINLLREIHFINPEITDSEKIICHKLWEILAENTVIKGINKNYVKKYIDKILNINYTDLNPKKPDRKISNEKFTELNMNKEFLQMYLNYSQFANKKPVTFIIDNENLPISKINKNTNYFDKLLEKGKEYENRRLEKKLLKDREEIQNLAESKENVLKTRKTNLLSDNKIHRNSLIEYFFISVKNRIKNKLTIKEKNISINHKRGFSSYISSIVSCEEKKPSLLLEIKVNLGENKKEKVLQIFEGQDIEKTIEIFGIMNSIFINI